jgi:hypothetical protein
MHKAKQYVIVSMSRNAATLFLGSPDLFLGSPVLDNRHGLSLHPASFYQLSYCNAVCE